MNVDGSARHAKEDASYFIAWIDQLIASTQANKVWNSESEKQIVMDQLSRARKVYAGLQN
jgi:hypothetical protein